MKAIYSFLITLLIGQCLFAQAPPILRNSWTTNTAGTPVRGVNDLSITNAGSGTNWTFFGISPQTVARLTDATNISASGPFIRSDSTGRGTNTTFVSAFTNLDNWVSSTGVLDTAIGVNVQPLGGNAKRNTFIGQEIAVTFPLDSGNDLTNSDNVAVGVNNLINLNGGSRNVAIGSTALQEAIDTVADIGIGYRALTSIKGGSSVIGIGDGVMFLATNIVGCVGIGIEAGLNITNFAYYVTMIGHHAGYGTLTQAGSPGYGSTWIGAASGEELRTNVAHAYTTAIGFRSGLYGGSNCTYLGAFAGRYNTNDGTRLIIDGLDRASYEQEKEKSMVYGVMDLVPANQTLRFNVGGLATGHVLGEFAPQGAAALDVGGFAIFRGSRGAIAVQGDWNPTNGAGLELKYSGGIAYIDTFDRTAGTWKPTVMRGSTYQINGNGGTPALMIDVLGAVHFPQAHNVGGPTTFTNRAHHLAQTTVTNSLGSNVVLRIDTTARQNALLVSSNGAASVSAGNSTSNAVISGSMFATTGSFTNLNATGTTSNLANVIIPAHFMTNNLDAVHAIWRGNMPLALANTNQFQIVFGSTTILDTGLQAASNSVWQAECWITRTGNTSQHVEGRFEWGPGNGVPFAFTNSNLEIAETNGINTTLALRGGALRLGAHTNNFFRVWYEPATR